MRRALLHIGLPKTGTTSIQRFLFENSGRLNDLGYAYPHFLRGQNHLELAVYAIDENHISLANIAGIREKGEWLQWRDGFRDTFLSQVQKSPGWIFSSEHIASRLKDKERVVVLKELLDEVFDEVRVLLYVRRQDDMALSSYSTWILDGRERPFDTPSVLTNSNRYDFRLIIERWWRVFGRSQVSVRLFPRVGSDLLNDFALAIGAADPESWVRPERLNKSLSAAELEFLRRFNSLYPRLDSSNRRLPGRRNPVRFIRGAIPGPTPRMSAEDSIEIMQFYRDSNRWVSEEAIDDNHDAGYFDPVTDSDEISNITDLTVDQALQGAVALWMRGDGERGTEASPPR